MTLSATHKQKIFQTLLLVCIGIAVFYYRYRLLLAYSFLYTDSDQNIMWGGLKDYASGVFREPRFYGQRYNSFLEALLAIPLYRVGYQAYTALPFISMCLTLFPFYYLGLLTLLRRSAFYAFLIVSMPLFLPFEYGVITSMPRGFVTGLPFAAIACTPIFYEKEKRFFMLSGMMSVIGISLNSNVVLLVLPCLLYLWLTNLKNVSFYFWMGLGLMLAGSLHWAVGRFYESHPFYDIHPMTLSFEWEKLINGLKNINDFINYDAPFFWHHGVIALLVPVLYAVFFYKQKNVMAMLTVLAMLLLLLFSFGFNKIYDGTDSLHFHSARMFITIPLLWVFCFILTKPTYEPMAVYLVVLLPWHYYKIQTASIEENVGQLVKQKTTEVVIVSPVKPILSNCKSLNEIALKHQVELFVVVNHFYADAYASGCAACFDTFPKTLNTNFERRTWRLLEDEKKVYRQIMLIDMFQKIDTTLGIVKKLPGVGDLYLVQNNHLKTMQLLDTLHIAYRRFR